MHAHDNYAVCVGESIGKQYLKFSTLIFCVLKNSGHWSHSVGNRSLLVDHEVPGIPDVICDHQ